MKRELIRSAVGGALACLLLVGACADSEPSAEPALRWSLLEADRRGALLSVWGSAHDDVWVVGGDQGDSQGPTVLHYDGDAITSLSTGVEHGDLWWVTGTPGGSVFMGGESGLLLRYHDGRFETMDTPSSATIFGLWAASEDEVWAVGGRGAIGAFAWRLRDGQWQPVEGFSELRAAGGDPLEQSASLRKVWGTSSTDVWMVGTAGTTVHYDGERFTLVPVPRRAELFTVHADGEHVAAVGGVGSGVIYEHAASGWRDVTPSGAPELTGVWLRGGSGYAVGGSGQVYRRVASTSSSETAKWVSVDTGDLVTEDLHSVWVDERGCVFSAGGRWRAFPLTRGLLLHGCP
jgi:hypothetical protein